MKTVQKRSGMEKNGRRCWLTVLAVLMLPAVFLWRLPVNAAESEHRQTSWHNGAGVADFLDIRQEEETPGSSQEEETNGSSQEEEVSGSLQEEETSGSSQKKEASGISQKKEASDISKEEKTSGIRKKEETEPEQEENKEQLVMAHVNHVLNVRREPGSEAELAGYLYADCGGIILDRKDGWTKLESGELVGWASDDYLLFGKEAEKAAEDNGRIVATTTTGALRIRKAPSLDAGVYDLLEEGAEYEVVNAEQLTFSDGIEISDDWVAVDYEGKTGFVSADYVKVEHLVDHGETIEQVAKRKEEEKRQAEALKAEQDKASAKAKKEKQQKEIEKVRALETADDLLLAALIQCEAGSDVYEGQVAVGAVVMNRVKSPAYPNTIKDVIFASGQFTPAGSGKLGRVLASGKIKSTCIQAAQDAIAGVSPVGSATHFRRAGSREGTIVGAHVFW